MPEGFSSTGTPDKSDDDVPLYIGNSFQRYYVAFVATTLRTLQQFYRTGMYVVLAKVVFTSMTIACAFSDPDYRFFRRARF